MIQKMKSLAFLFFIISSFNLFAQVAMTKLAPPAPAPDPAPPAPAKK